MQYNTANQLISYQGKTIEYDAYGNMTKGPANGSMAAYTYDSRNRLTGVLNLSYKYDAENNRIATTDSQTGKTIRYIHNTNSDLSQLLVEEDGTTTTKYVYGNELISAKTYEKSLEELKQEGDKNKKSGNQQADISYYYHYDNLKSTTLLTDETGEVVETYDYGTYGEVISGDTTLTRFLYNGGLGVSSDSNGLYYMRARYYNPTIRRFINQDVKAGSMNDSASLNRYAYVQGNPISLTDPFGLSPDMEYGNYEANALKRLFKVANKVADYLPVVGTARDIKRSYNAFKNGNIADGIKHGATAALSLAVPTAKLATKAVKTTLKLAKNALKAEKCISKTAEIATEGIKLAKDVSKASKLAGKAGSVSAKIAKSVKNGVSTVARTVKRNATKVYKKARRKSDNLLSEETFTRYMADGKQFTDVTALPGGTGINLSRRLTTEEMTFLTQEYGVEFAQVYKYGAGINGGGGQYRLYSGTVNSVRVPVANDIMLINHTHPCGTAYPSSKDKILLEKYQQLGSPQRSSEIIPVGKENIRFNANGLIGGE